MPSNSCGAMGMGDFGMACGKTDIAAFLSGGFVADPDFLFWEVACACCMVLLSINLRTGDLLSVLYSARVKTLLSVPWGSKCREHANQTCIQILCL